MPRDGRDNLIPFNKLTEEQQREFARKGGKASAEARKKKKTFREIVQMIGDLPVKDEKLLKDLKKLGIDIDEEDITYSFLVNFSQFYKAIKSRDTKSAEYLRDTIGEKPSVNQNVSVNVEIEDLTPIADMLGVVINGNSEDSKD